MVGRTILQYQLLEKLGAGGMGEIYKAQDTRLNRTVAIKLLSLANAGDPERRRRFIQEAQAASALNHPNIITIHDIVTDEGSQFMVMEFVAGKTLAELIPAGGIGVQQSLTYAVQMASALEAAHAARIIHRDLKPGNVMVTDSGLVKILDFGLAKLSQAGPVTLAGDETKTIAPAPMTVEGSIIGTVSYMSPEQAQGKAVDARSDIFSFGVLLYEMLTGRRAFSGDSTLLTLSSILRDEVKPVSQELRIPPELDQLILRALQKDPNQRWQSMKEVLAVLAAVKQRIDSGILYPQAPPQPRRGRKIALVAAAAIVIAGLAIGAWGLSHRQPAAAPISQTVAPPQPATAQQPVSTPDDSNVLTNQGVIEMVEAKVSPTLIIEQIRSSKTKFDLSTPEIIRLTKAGVPDAVIEVMRNPKKAIASAATPKPASPQQDSSQPPAPQPPAPETAKPALPTMPDVAIPNINLPGVDAEAILASMPIFISLDEDVPANAAPGRPLRFTVARAFHVRGGELIGKGTRITGKVVEGKPGVFAFELNPVDTADGRHIRLHVPPNPAPIGYFPHPKELAATAGTLYLVHPGGPRPGGPHGRRENPQEPQF
ncbi:MAG TPA: serine/threonine-protein kinase [Bryobacteraceae bacterium]|nr:serine/threonine-protein kinase [Bryobacteraceae bacterium]